MFFDSWVLDWFVILNAATLIVAVVFFVLGEAGKGR
ncbi:hypothetical protein BCF33_1365 [Hasllibacter halocynthiae]|uniref:Uncharacterized protein n=1 Tax=Hasllibacter halocynthiae TaxID=595589 RepID=A0A2T0X9W8_9RHOB|nr:hypothetical protein BCF33_1365 [Hasllibacter halocynthiae]